MDGRDGRPYGWCVDGDAQPRFFLRQDRRFRRIGIVEFDQWFGVRVVLGSMPLQMPRVAFRDLRRLLPVDGKRLGETLVPQPIRGFLNQQLARQRAHKGVQGKERLHGFEMLRGPVAQRLAMQRQGQRLPIDQVRTFHRHGVGRTNKLFDAFAVIRGNGTLQNQVTHRAEIRGITVKAKRRAAQLNTIVQDHPALGGLLLFL